MVELALVLIGKDLFGLNLNKLITIFSRFSASENKVHSKYRGVSKRDE